VACSFVLAAVAAAGCSISDRIPTADSLPGSGSADGDGAAGPADALTVYDYEITVVNLSQGQPFSPPVIATHRGDGGVWKLGTPAGNGVVQIAENGNNGPLMTELTDRRLAGELVDVGQGTSPLVPAGSPGAGPLGDGPCAQGCPDRATLRLYAPADDPRLSWVSMLVCTNDGFTGVNSVELPTEIGEEVVVEATGYETSTERNTEDLADIMPPCQALIGVTSPSGAPGTAESNPELAESGNVVPHRGIIGGAELDPAIHGWGDPVAKLIITRIS
jgi:hypothetical protein